MPKIAADTPKRPVGVWGVLGKDAVQFRGFRVMMCVCSFICGFNRNKFKEIQEPFIVVGELKDGDLVQCEELGMGFAAGLEAGIF